MRRSRLNSEAQRQAADGRGEDRRREEQLESRSDVEAEVHGVAVAHHVVLALDVQLGGGAAGGLASRA